jgi:hypothetical protein
MCRHARMQHPDLLFVNYKAGKNKDLLEGFQQVFMIKLFFRSFGGIYKKS